MNNSVPFTIVDVFAETKYAGNQLAVFKDAGSLSSETMQRFAKETNFSETTFILSDTKKNGGYDVRIFTPNAEVPFAGHPTLGTAYIIQDAIESAPQTQINLNYSIGQIPVSFPEGKNGILWMRQNAPVFGQTFTAEEFAPLTSLHADDIDPRFPIQIVSTGLPFTILPVKSLRSVETMRVKTEHFLPFVEDKPAKGLLVFSTETVSKEADLHVRVFVDYYGIPEDPATGSGNGCLAGYLVQHKVLDNSSINISTEQGLEINRPSRLYLRASKVDNQIEVNVGGKVQKVAEGHFI